ncbi:alpha/beta fold hydrolase [Microvirga sp. VF16]|uniref:alpha/beta fold hydrolase n=1 Tax=Microvirga sp. VF16 TaxID=2807101 RepID=UPI00193DCBB9|nr:alpha/beta fold hydrolase [Microvirga sp. VF16]QRM32591.1 alpha/beta fold hydrolase [Microvirga sp. VF16]
MPTIKLSRAELFYELRGQGPIMCHLHGGTLGRHHFALLSPILAERFQVLDFDLRGVGDSASDPMPDGLSDWADDTLELLNALGLDRVSLHGSSAGGLVALEFAAKYPDRVDHLILSCIHARPDNADRLRRRIRAALTDGADPEALLAWYTFMFFSRGYLESAHSVEGRSLLRRMMDTMQAAQSLAPSGGPRTDTDMTALLQRISSPTLVIAGSQDITIPLNGGLSGVGPRQMARELSGHLEVIDAGHLALVERPHDVAEVITRWIDGNFPAAAHRRNHEPLAGDEKLNKEGIRHMLDQSPFAWLANQRVLVDGLSDDACGLADFLLQRARKVSVLGTNQHEHAASRVAKLKSAGATFIERDESKVTEFGDADTLFVDLFTSPRSALVQEARDRGLRLSSLAEVIVSSGRGRTIGVTGSAGKTTTTYLISAVLRAAGFATRASTDDRFTPSGPGHAMLASLPSLRDEAWRVVELTSHHLEYVSTSPHIAVVTNLFADHQDWHGSFDAYKVAKMRLLSFQNSGDVAVLNYDDQTIRSEFAPIVKGRTLFYSISDAVDADVLVSDGTIMVRTAQGLRELCTVDDLSMPRHHISNALAAAAAGVAAGASLESIASALRAFAGLPQRGQVAGHVGSVAIHDDTIALNPKKALLGLEAFAFDDVVVVSGGATVSPGGEQRVSSDLEKADLQLYCRELGRKAKAVVLYGDGGEAIRKMLATEGQKRLTVDVAPDFEAALAQAIAQADPNSRVLVAPVFYNRPADLKHIIERAVQPQS